MVSNMYKFMRPMVAIILAVALSALFVQHTSAATGSIYLSPSSRTVTGGSNFSVSIRMSSSDAVNAVQANLNYPTDKLDFISTSFSGSAFEIQAQSTGGGGKVQIARGTTSSVSGDKLIATVTFKAKPNSGSTAITVASDSTLVNNGTEIPSSKGSATITFTKPAAPSAPAAPPPADKTPPTISDIKVTDIGTNSVSITWTTNEPASSAVDYGLTTANGLSLSNDEKVTSHKVILNSSFMLPKTSYHFIASSVDASGNKQAAPDQTFTTKGIPVTVTVQNKQGKAVSKAKVQVAGSTYETDKNGRATLELGLGKQTIAVAKSDVQTSTSLELTAADILKTDTAVSITLPVVAHFNWLIPILPAAFAVGIIAGIMLRRRAPLNRLKHLLSKGQDSMKISELERQFGDAHATTNPYAPPKQLDKFRRLRHILQATRRTPRE